MSNNSPSCYDGKTAEFISAEIKDLLRSGRIELVTDKSDIISQVRRVLALLVVDNGRKLRLCWDGRDLNAHIFCESFKMETVAVAARMMQSGDFMFTLVSLRD